MSGEGTFGTSRTQNPEIVYSRADSKDEVAGDSYTPGPDDVDTFDYLQSYDWLEKHDVDPGNLQDLAELKRLIKSHILKKTESTEDLCKNQNVALSSGASKGVGPIYCNLVNCHLSITGIALSRILDTVLNRNRQVYF